VHLLKQRGYAVSQTKKLYRLFQEKQIPVIRMGLQASDSLHVGTAIVAGPYHPAFGHLVLSEIFLEKAVRLLQQMGPLSKKITLRVHPRSISKMRGLQNGNIERLLGRFDLEAVIVVADDTLSMDGVSL
ncbi:hypothetical protein ACFL2E_08210, partial [Thermodesulfobacteriota bacterium]